MEQLLSIQPQKTINFSFIDNKYESKLIITNVSAIFIAFKIRISNQADYFVKPSIGVLKTGSSVTIKLTTENGESIQGDKIQILAGPITVNEDAIQYFKKQQRLNSTLITCQLDQVSSIQTSTIKRSISGAAQETEDIKQTVKLSDTKRTPKIHKQTKEQIILDQIKQISEEIQKIKLTQDQKKGITIGLKPFLISITIAIIMGVYITYR